MVTLRILAVLIFLFGLVQTLIGVAGLLMIDTSISSLEIMREGGALAVDDGDLSAFRTGLFINAVLMTVSGSMSIVSGVGIFFRKNWARLLCLVTLTIMAAGMIYTMTVSSINQGINAVDVLAQAGVLLLYAILFYFFSREKTRSYFKGN